MPKIEIARDRVAVLEEANDALTRLSPDEEILLRWRFGIGDRRRPLKAIAARLGVKREDLVSVEARALMRLRRDAVAKAARTRFRVLQRHPSA